MKYFDQFIGQERVKRKLSFYIDSFHRTKTMPFLNMTGARGLGKTEFARAVSAALTDSGTPRTFLEINSSTIKSLNNFLDNFFLPSIFDKDVTVLLDECHMLPSNLVNAFLTVFNSDPNPIRRFAYNDAFYEFNFLRQTFIFATTENDRLFHAFKDRLTQVNFVDYPKDDLKKIIQNKVPQVKFDDQALDFLAESGRGNARGCVKMADEVLRFVQRRGRGVKFTDRDAQDLAFEIDLLPYGITAIERQILQTLRSIGSASLTMLAAKTGLTKTSLQKDHELYLLKKGFLCIDGKRFITKEGCALIDHINRNGL